MKWNIFSHRPVEGAATGTEALNRWDFEGDEDGYVADEVVEELRQRGHQVVAVQPVEPEPERRSRRRR